MLRRARLVITTLLAVVAVVESAFALLKQSSTSSPSTISTSRSIITGFISSGGRIGDRGYLRSRPYIPMISDSLTPTTTIVAEEQHSPKSHSHRLMKRKAKSDSHHEVSIGGHDAGGDRGGGGQQHQAASSSSATTVVGRARDPEPPRSPSSRVSFDWGAPSMITAGGSAVVATADVISLNSIRSTLIRQEDSIIFALIERAQFRHNPAIYAKGILQLDKKVPDYDFLSSLSFLEYMLLETEKVHGKVRRYTSPEEHAFFPEHIPSPILNPLQYPALLAPNTVDVNPQILSRYINEIVPAVCKPGDDEQHGSSVLADITALQAISKRIHLGKFVAETKFQENEKKYTELMMNDDVDGVMEALTNRAVEERVLQRAELKASTYGQDITGESADVNVEPSVIAAIYRDLIIPLPTMIQRAELKASTYGQDITGETADFKVKPSVIAAIYRDLIIPLTKDLEVLYLFQRIGREPPKAYMDKCRVFTLA